MSAYAAAVSRARDNTRFAKASEIETAIATGGAGAASGAIAGLLAGKDKEKSSQLYNEFKHWVYVALSAIATRLASQPFGAGTLVGTAKAKSLPDGSKARRATLPNCLKEMTGGGQEIEAILDHDILDFLQHPNPVQGKFEFLFSICANLNITGQAYIVATQVKGKDDPDGYGVELWAVPTPWITPKHGKKLFESYELKKDAQSEAIPLPANAVCRLYIPDPNDPKGCIAPLATQLPAVKIDSAIQKSQAAMFERGIWPNVVLSVGQQKGPDGRPLGRPTLNGKQRNQILRAVRQLWKQDVTSNGDPAIVDGLIESINKLSNTPAEMDWLQSSEMVKKRIFQAFKVNPIICGEIGGVNRAQAAVADQQFCDQAVNPLIDMISSKLLNDFVAGLFDETDTLVLWLETATPKDAEQKLREYDIGVRNGAASKDDYRREILGLPPLPVDATADASPLLETVGGMSGFVQILQAVGMGMIAPDSAQAAFKLFYRIDDSIAAELLGSTGSLGLLAPAPAGGQSGGQNGGQDSTVQNDDEQADLPDSGDVADAAAPALIALKGGLPSITRSAVKASRRTTQLRREKEVAKSLVPFSQASIGQRLLSLLNCRPES